MSEVSLFEWNQFISRFPDAHLLQMSEWGELKRGFGWEPVRLISDDGAGAQILFRRLPLGLTLAYMPKPVFSGQWPVAGVPPLFAARTVSESEWFWMEVDSVCKKHHAVFLKLEPDSWNENSILHPAKRSFILQFVLPSKSSPMDFEAAKLRWEAIFHPSSYLPC